MRCSRPEKNLYAVFLLFCLTVFICPHTSAAKGPLLIARGNYKSLGILDLEATISALPPGILSVSSNDDVQEKSAFKPDIFNVTLVEPRNKTLIPLDLAAPLFTWAALPTDPDGSFLAPGSWLITISSGSDVICRLLTDQLTWEPDAATWHLIRTRTMPDTSKKGTFPFQVDVVALGGWDGRTPLGRSRISLFFSSDPIDAPIVFARKPVPFSLGQAHPEKSSWIRADLSRENGTSTVLKDLPVCANCHAFSPNGQFFGMDADIEGDKGAYLLAPVSERVHINKDNVISWNDRPAPPPAEFSFGLFTALSPDGRLAASTIGETSLFVRMNDLAFSQLFFPVTGRIGLFEVSTRRHFDLKGADSAAYVQTAPAFSPDGTTLVFSRAPVIPTLLEAVQSGIVKAEPPTSSISELNRKYPIQFDLYTLSLSTDGAALPKPLKGGSNNGKSNYFARYSPDGRWIVFVQSPTGLVLQPGSKLCIIPAEGGDTRILKSNLDVMNSWHSWSPNGRWMVFSGKDRSPVTELFLTHIDAQGDTSPAVRLHRLSSLTEAAMVPEFVPGPGKSFKEIKFSFPVKASKPSRDENIR